MIQAKDLRIGNIVYFDFSHDEEKIITEIVGISESGDISVIKNKVKIYECSEDSIYLIPLTEEWLLRFGYKQISGIHRTYSKTNYVDNTSIWNFNSNYCHINTNTIVKSVHQLMNLYFALTNKELIYEN